MSLRAPIAGLLIALAAPGCAPRPPVEPRATLTQADWSEARARLASMRATQRERPYVVVLRVAMREPWTHRSFLGRGALAVQPHVAARMILVGPGGGTALDMWLTRTRFRFVVPAADFKRAGGASAEEARGLPVGFFRWWFLSPLEGRLLAASVNPVGRTFVLREGGGTVTLRERLHERGGHDREHLVARRREAGQVETLEWTGRTIAPHAGDRARYVQDATGFEIEVLVEAVGADEPDPAAFLDPDDPGVPL
jgi:hypothetical protein